jgi:glycosyltransferase involved in cell wall biosynthesis
MSSKALEYVAAGKPLVISDLAASRRLFGDAALYYRPADPDDLARQLGRLLAEPELVNDLLARARSVLERCSWNLMVERLAELYVGSKNGFVSDSIAKYSV